MRWVNEALCAVVASAGSLNLTEESHVWGTKYPAAIIAVATRRPSGDATGRAREPALQ